MAPWVILRLLKTGGGMFFGTWETAWLLDISGHSSWVWTAICYRSLSHLGVEVGRGFKQKALQSMFSSNCHVIIVNNRTTTTIIVKPIEHPEYDGHYSRQLIGIKSFEFDTKTLDGKHSLYADHYHIPPWSSMSKELSYLLAFHEHDLDFSDLTRHLYFCLLRSSLLTTK